MTQQSRKGREGDTDKWEGGNRSGEENLRRNRTWD